MSTRFDYQGDSFSTENGYGSRVMDWNHIYPLFIPIMIDYPIRVNIQETTGSESQPVNDPDMAPAGSTPHGAMTRLILTYPV